MKPDGKLNTRKGALSHAELIGKRPRDTVLSTQGESFRLFTPTLAEYVTLTPRLVTPIYPQDANLLVSLLDIHVPTPDENNGGSSLEILEAGTGHGALTLHLARAICPATSPRGHLNHSNEPTRGIENSPSAVLHTVDISARHSSHAENLVRGFRKGIYASNVHFHVGDIPQFIEQQFSARASREPFLSYAVCDFRAVHQSFKNLAPAMVRGGIVAVFCPQMTQILQCVETVEELHLPFAIDQVVEFGHNISGGKQWDIRPIKVKQSSATTASNEPSKAMKAQRGLFQRIRIAFRSFLGGRESAQAEDGQGNGTVPEIEQSRFLREITCRPKAYQHDGIIAGCFVGLWRCTA